MVFAKQKLIFSFSKSRFHPNPTLRRFMLLIAALLPVVLFFPAGCSDDDSTPAVDATLVDGGDGGPLPDGGPDADQTDGAPLDAAIDADIDAAQLCGNGVIDDDEVCDDGNNVSGDGCNATCTQVDDEDLVANAYTGGDQSETAAASRGDKAVVAWTDSGSLDNDGTSVNYRCFGADGAPQIMGSNSFERVANTNYSGDQYAPAVGVAPNGDFVVVWTDAADQITTGLNVWARLFNSDGTAKTNALTQTDDAFLVHGSTGGDQTAPRVAVSDGGYFLIVWTDNNALDGSGRSIQGRLFDPSGAPQVNADTGDASPFTINTNGSGHQHQPAVACNADAQWVVVWTDESGWADTNGSGITATLLATADAANTVGGDVAINTTTSADQSHPTVIGQTSAGFAVFWTDDSGSVDFSFTGIRGRLLDGQGIGRTNAITNDTNDFQVNTLTTGRQQRAAVAASGPLSDLVVAWQDGSGTDGSFAGIRGRLLRTNGAPATNPLTADSDDFQINSVTADAQLAPVVATPGPIGLVFWTDNSSTPPDETGTAVRMRVLGLDW